MKYPIQFVPQGVIPHDPNLTVTMQRVPPVPVPVRAAAPVVSITWPYLDEFDGTGSLLGHRADTGQRYGVNDPDEFNVLGGGVLRLSGPGINSSIPVMQLVPSINVFVVLAVISRGWATFNGNQVGATLRDGDGSYSVRVTLPSPDTSGDFAYEIAKFVAFSDPPTVIGSGLFGWSGGSEEDEIEVGIMIRGDVITLTIDNAFQVTVTDADVPPGQGLQLHMNSGPDPNSHLQFELSRAQAFQL